MGTTQGPRRNGAGDDPAGGAGREAPAPARVLVVEDHADIREIFCRVLELAGYRVTPAGDGLAGLEAFLSGAFEAVVTDLFLPGLGGQELVSRIRKIRPRTAIVVLTGLPTDEVLSAAWAGGADEVLVKPLPSLKALPEAVERALRVRRAAD